MNIKILRKSLQWQDLRSLTKWQIVYNVLLPYPFLALEWWSAWQVATAQSLMDNPSYTLFYVGMALIGWFLFFAGSFRQAHDGFHRTLGLGKTATDWLLWWSSGLLISSNHAVRQTHLQHHRNPLAEDDLEAEFHKLTWWQAILGGFGFYLRLQTRGLALSNERKAKGSTRALPDRRLSETNKIFADFAFIAVVVVLAVVLSSMGFYLLLAHVAVMMVGNSFVGFVAGWCVHHDCHTGDGENGEHSVNSEVIARTERNRLVNFLTFNLLHHQEHHLFPAVPTSNLPTLAKRLDEIAPEVVSLRVVPELSKVFDSKSNDDINKSLQLEPKLAKI